MENNIVYPNLDNDYTTQRRVVGNDYVFNLYDFHYNGQIEILYISDNITIESILEKLDTHGYCPFQINSNRIQVNSLVNIEEVLKELDSVQEYAEKETCSNDNTSNDNSDVIIMSDNDVQPNSSRTSCARCSSCVKYLILGIVIAIIVGVIIYLVLEFA